MKKWSVIGIFFAGVIGASVFFLFLGGSGTTSLPPARGQAPAEKKVKWEYGSLTSRQVVANTEGPGSAYWEWERAWDGPKDERPAAKNYIELGKKMKINVTLDDSTCFLNALGEDGWELTSYTITWSSVANHDFPHQTWILRRQK